MAGAVDLDAWWRNIQVGDICELFVMGDVVQESETRRRSKKGRDDKRTEGWRPCTVLSIDGTGQRAKAVVSFTDLNGEKAQETIPIRDSGGGRLRQCARALEESSKDERPKAKKNKKDATEQGEEDETPAAKAVSTQSDKAESQVDLVGTRVKVLYNEDEWYEGIIRNKTKKAGEYCIVFEDDEETTAVIPSPEGDVELIFPKEELCDKVKQDHCSEGGLVYRVLHTCLVKSRNLKSNQELPGPYTQLMTAVMGAVTRKIRCAAS